MRPSQPGSERRHVTWSTDYSSLIIGGRSQPKLEDSESPLLFAYIKNENKSIKVVFLRIAYKKNINRFRHDLLI